MRLKGILTGFLVRAAQPLGLAATLPLPGKVRGMCLNRKAWRWERFLMTLPARGSMLGLPLLILLALLLGTASPTLGADKFCSDPPYFGVIDGNIRPVPVQITIDQDCTFKNFPESNPLTATINFQTNDPTIYLIIFDNVYYTGNMACANIDHRIWFSNSSYYGSNNACQDLFIPVETIDKKNPVGQTTAAHAPGHGLRWRALGQ
jgi:hypothetical protein